MWSIWALKYHNSCYNISAYGNKESIYNNLVPGLFTTVTDVMWNKTFVLVVNVKRLKSNTEEKDTAYPR